MASSVGFKTSLTQPVSVDGKECIVLITIDCKDGFESKEAVNAVLVEINEALDKAYERDT